MDPENGKVIQTYNYKGEGLKRKNPGATPATKPPTRAQLTQVEVNKQKALNAGRLQFQKDLSEAITPEDKEAAATNYKAAVQEAQLGYEHELSTLLGKDVPHNSWTDQFRPDTGAESTQPSTTKPVPKPTVRPQTGGGQQPQTKTLSLADLHAYVAAQKKLNPSFTEEDARREAKQRGYSVQGDENLAQRKAASGK
jgi:heme-binding NEAT domain protein